MSLSSVDKLSAHPGVNEVDLCESVASLSLVFIPSLLKMPSILLKLITVLRPGNKIEIASCFLGNL